MDGTLLKAFFTLGGVVVVMALVLFIVRRYAATQIGKGMGSQFRILAQITVQPRKNICLLLVADRILVVGIADHAIQTLTEITDPDTIQKMIHSKASGTFLSSLRTPAERPDQEQASSPTATNILSFSEFLKSLGKKEHL